MTCGCVITRTTHKFDAPDTFRIKYCSIHQDAEQNQQARILLQRLVNLAQHPYFPDLPDLPAWAELIQKAKEAL